MCCVFRGWTQHQQCVWRQLLTGSAQCTGWGQRAQSRQNHRARGRHMHVKDKSNVFLKTDKGKFWRVAARTWSFPLTSCLILLTRKIIPSVKRFSPSCTEAQRVMRRRMLALVPMVCQWLNGALLRFSSARHNSVACRCAAACVQVPRLRRSFISPLPHKMLHPHVLPVQPQRATPKAVQKLWHIPGMSDAPEHTPLPPAEWGRRTPPHWDAMRWWVMHFHCWCEKVAKCAALPCVWKGGLLEG